MRWSRCRHEIPTGCEIRDYIPRPFVVGDWGISAASAMVMLLSGCADIQYMYNIPDGQSDCPSGTVYRNGGTGIIDRDGGTGIIDRDGDTVHDYCEPQTCPDGVTVPSGEIGIVWHQEDHDQVLARGACPASP